MSEKISLDSSEFGGKNQVVVKQMLFLLLSMNTY